MIEILSSFLKTQKRELHFAIAWAVTSILFVFSVTALADEHREKHAHEHGAVTLNFVIEGSRAELELEAPAHDIVGFEHTAKKDADIKTVHQKYGLLEKVNSVLRLPAEAECTQTGVEISGQVFNSVNRSTDKGHERTATQKHNGHDGQGEHDEHSEVDVVYELICKKARNLKEVKILLFEHFPEIKRIETQVVKDEKQFGGLVTSKSPYLPGF